MKGLWVQKRNNVIIVNAVPESTPWDLLEKGMIFNTEPLNARASEEAVNLIGKIQELKNLNPSVYINQQYLNYIDELADKGLTATEINHALESAMPLRQRIKQTGQGLKMLPSNNAGGEWHSLHALSLIQFNPSTGSVEPIGNFTAYPDALFSQVQKQYIKLSSLASQKQNSNLAESINQLESLLMEGYTPIAGTKFKAAAGKSLYYPSLNQLKAESLYYSIHWVGIASATYAIALICLLLGWKRAGFISLALAFIIHTWILALRCYILGRPPVSNMFETVIYVPWITVAFGIGMRFIMKSSIPLIAASVFSLGLFLVLDISGLNGEMENVQAVLDSQFWLLIHVLMVVGSYGLYGLCGILGHVYLIQCMRCDHESFAMKKTAQSLIQAMYLGTALLIPGTILGGVWAAESWGRFWDWDPKEAWAFITACIYAMIIHAYRFRHIANFGLAIGSIFGLMAVSFTWYGVNYILGTGLHSYGFGTGGEEYYYLYLLIEVVFISCALLFLGKKNLQAR